MPSSPSLRPPRLARETEAVRPRAPLPQFGVCKAEVSSIELVEFVAEAFNEFEDVKPDVKVALDPRQSGDQLKLRIAALAIRPAPSSDSSSASEAAAPGLPRFAEWGIRTQSHTRIPEQDLGPADPPRRRRRP